nr:MAG: tetratricopeptide repeat protein [Hyphomicrobiales bacterium]
MHAWHELAICFASSAMEKKMRVNAILVLLAVLCTSAPASAQTALGNTAIECQLGMRELCWAQTFGRCAHENPRIAIRACTRQLLGRDSASRTRMVTAQTYSLRGTAHLKLGDVDEALNDFDRALKTYGNLYWIHLARGAVLFAIGDDREALESFDDAVVLAPNSPVALNERARLLASAQDDNVRNGQQAIADARRAGELAPGWPDNVAVLASAYAENGEFDNAVATQQSAIDLLRPDLPEADLLAPDLLEGSDGGAIDAYLGQLDLYRRGRQYRREFVSCQEDAGPSGPGNEENVVFVTYIEVFCLADGA